MVIESCYKTPARLLLCLHFIFPASLNIMLCHYNCTVMNAPLLPPYFNRFRLKFRKCVITGSSSLERDRKCPSFTCALLTSTCILHLNAAQCKYQTFSIFFFITSFCIHLHPKLIFSLIFADWWISAHLLPVKPVENFLQQFPVFIYNILISYMNTLMLIKQWNCCIIVFSQHEKNP